MDIARMDTVKVDTARIDELADALKVDAPVINSHGKRGARSAAHERTLIRILLSHYAATPAAVQEEDDGIEGDNNDAK